MQTGDMADPVDPKRDVVDMREAEKHLSRLVDRVERGREVEIARAGKPVVKLVPIMSDRRRRPLGRDRGRVWIAADFDGALPAEDFPGDLA